MRPVVAVIGGGISGLAAAWRLHELAPAAEVILLEAASRLGGVIQTVREKGFLIETAADGFLTSPSAAVDLCRRIGLGDTLRSPGGPNRRALVVCQGELEPIPEGFSVLAPSRIWPLVTSPIMSLWGKLRAALELLVPSRSGDDDESLESFVCRRFGSELYERLAQPLVGGIYSADPARLSLQATLPRFHEMERKHGSLLWAMLRSAEQGGGARYAQFATPASGMGSLVAALAAKLPEGSVRLDSPVDAVLPAAGERWLLKIGGPHSGALVVDGLIVAAPAEPAAKMLGRVDAGLADELGQIDYASCAIASLGYRQDQIGHALDGFGFVTPLVESRRILSCSFSSVKYEGRAPEGDALLRVFIGGACQAELLELDDERLLDLAQQEVADLLKIRGRPRLAHLVRHRRAMPQYHVGHRRRVARIGEQLERFPTLALAGSALHGVGVPGCVGSGEAAAEQLAGRLSLASVGLPQPL